MCVCLCVGVYVCMQARVNACVWVQALSSRYVEEKRLAEKEVEREKQKAAAAAQALLAAEGQIASHRLDAQQLGANISELEQALRAADHLQRDLQASVCLCVCASLCVYVCLHSRLHIKSSTTSMQPRMEVVLLARHSRLHIKSSTTSARASAVGLHGGRAASTRGTHTNGRAHKTLT